MSERLFITVCVQLYVCMYVCDIANVAQSSSCMFYRSDNYESV